MRELSTVCVEDLDTPVPRQQFSLGAIAGCLASVLCAGMPLQRVPAAQEMQGSWCGVPMAAASYYSVRLWLLRLGLYQLSRAKQQADDWMWIIDHTLQLGDRKCLVIVGLRQSAWEQAESRVLSHEDVELIDLQPVIQSNGKVVYQQLKAAAAKTGVPRAIISDKGSDLHCGIDLFRHRHRGTVWMYDIKHKTACLLKQALLSDRSWSKFTERAHRFKQQVSLSAWAGLAPPQQRSKARYMNVEVLTCWATRHLALLKSRKAIVQAGLKPAQVEEKLGWLRAFEPQIGRWGELLAVVETAEHYVRHEGLHQEAVTELDACMPKPATRAAAANAPTTAGVRSGTRAASLGGGTAVGLQRGARVGDWQVQVLGWRAWSPWDDRHGLEYRCVRRSTGYQHGTSRDGRSYHSRRVELVPETSWRYRAECPTQDYPSTGHRNRNAKQ